MRIISRSIARGHSKEQKIKACESYLLQQKKRQKTYLQTTTSTEEPSHKMKLI